MTPALVRIKKGVRRSIDLCGGIDGAAATVDRTRSVAGDWNNLNHAAMPSWVQALALDQVALAVGGEAPICAALCREAGGLFVPLPDCGADPDTMAGMVMRLAARLGAVSQEMAVALSDGVLTPAEASRVLTLQEELDGVSAQLRLSLRAIRDASVEKAQAAADDG